MKIKLRFLAFFLGVSILFLACEKKKPAVDHHPQPEVEKLSIQDFQLNRSKKDPTFARIEFTFLVPPYQKFDILPTIEFGLLENGKIKPLAELKVEKSLTLEGGFYGERVGVGWALKTKNPLPAGEYQVRVKLKNVAGEEILLPSSTYTLKE
jgi:hypothetical protein